MNRTQQFKIETPMGSVESDSGNHLMDIASVMLIIVCIAMFKKIWKTL
tara:strand:+ start:760 stop:903 length:144 start_codon:yes stop_codon:yes gene_type:complete